MKRTRLFKEMTNPRYCVVAVLVAVAVVMLMAEPTAGDEAVWALQLVLTKAVGLASAWGAVELGERWMREGKMPLLDAVTGDAPDYYDGEEDDGEGENEYYDLTDKM